jgi:glycosyltransferase involved in cell wall biosynthesis
MKILFLTRSTLYSVYGGDSVQVISTAKYLRRLGVEVDIKLSNEKIDYSQYDLLHIYNAIRPADALAHVKRSGKPYVLSPIYVDFYEYHKEHAKGVTALMSRYLSADQLEYAKVIARWIKNGEPIHSSEYFYLGHKKAVQKLAGGAVMLLPNSNSEHERFVKDYKVSRPYCVIYYGIDTEVFNIPELKPELRDPMQVICVARIEGKKNQLNLIKALNNTPYQLKLVGKPAPNHIAYYEECRSIAGPNVTFIDFLPQEQLAEHYLRSKVHVLASWHETCGLSSMEAAYAGCNLVITDKGDTVDYFGNDAWYCNPSSPESIYNAVKQASEAPLSMTLREKILTEYNWREAASQTLAAYELILAKKAVLIA